MVNLAKKAFIGKKPPCSRAIIFLMLKLYMRNGCPFCSLVKQELAKMDIDYEELNIADEKNREELVRLGGKQQVPFLIDEEAGVSMYESKDIIDYLRENYS